MKSLNNLAGSHYPIVVSVVGDWPRPENSGWFKVQAPCGVARRAWSITQRDYLVEIFLKCQSYIDGLDTDVVDERTGFELALLAEKKKGSFIGYDTEDELV